MHPTEIIGHMIYRISNAPVLTWPYPHLIVDEIFPAPFYEKLVSILETVRIETPDAEIPDTVYPKRHAFPIGPQEGETPPEAIDSPTDAVFALLTDPTLLQCLIGRFSKQITHRFGGEIPRARPNISYVHDESDYALGPHTDTARKLLSTLIYLAPDDRFPEAGTSIYVPGSGAPVGLSNNHYDRKTFVRVATVPYRPNQFFCFVPVENSFHGVETIGKDVLRRVILHNLYAA